jgi:hypothetical protein
MLVTCYGNGSIQTAEEAFRWFSHDFLWPKHTQSSFEMMEYDAFCKKKTQNRLILTLEISRVSTTTECTDSPIASWDFWKDQEGNSIIKPVHWGIPCCTIMFLIEMPGSIPHYTPPNITVLVGYISLHPHTMLAFIPLYPIVSSICSQATSP